MSTHIEDRVELRLHGMKRRQLGLIAEFLSFLYPVLMSG